MSKSAKSISAKSTNAVRTKQLTVNAAFLKEIKDDNQQLKTLWDQIVPIASHRETAINHWPSLMILTAELRDQLAMHFSLEEAYGYFDEAIDTAPQLSVVAECLRSEHGELFSQIRDLADSIAEVRIDEPESVGAYVARFQDFRISFEQHEEAELKMILQAMDDDIGGAG